MSIPKQIKRLFATERRCFLATCYRDKPHLSLMLFTYYPDEKLVILSSRRETTKVKNIEKNPEVALMLHNPGSGTEKPLSCTIYGQAKIIHSGADSTYKKIHQENHKGMDIFIAGDDKIIIVVKFSFVAVSDSEDQVWTWNAAK